MISLKRIRVPIALLSILMICISLFTPAYPVHVERTDAYDPCPPNDNCLNVTRYSQVDPLILVLASGFTWSAKTSTDGMVSNYSFSSDSWLAFMFVSIPIVISLLFLLRSNKKHWRSRIIFKRRYWRIFLWAIGFYFLVLGTLWSWNYAIFYGLTVNNALIDPFLTSLVGTFFLSGIGLAMMMLSVRSRALWAEKMDDD